MENVNFKAFLKFWYMCINILNVFCRVNVSKSREAIDRDTCLQTPHTKHFILQKPETLYWKVKSGDMAKWSACRTSNLAAWIKTQSGTSPCFPEQETLHSLLSTDWFQERIRKCVFNLIASYTGELE
jgi:hypothetical protein